MEAILRNQNLRQFIKFGLVGALSTAIDWGVFYLITSFGVFYLVAKILSFLLAAANGFILNRSWTFRSHGPKFQEGIKFVVVSSAGLVMNAYIMLLAVEKFHWRNIFGLILATGIVLFWNFLANKFWTFRET